MADEHVSERHLDFIKASIEDLQQQLKALNTAVLAVKGEVLDVFDKLQSFFNLTGIYSHIETGLGVTYLRDQKVADWCHTHNIHWKEYRQQGVFRALPNRRLWIKRWTEFMNRPQAPFPTKKGWLKLQQIESLRREFALLDCKVDANEQPTGGEQKAFRYLNSF